MILLDQWHSVLHIVLVSVQLPIVLSLYAPRPCSLWYITSLFKWLASMNQRHGRLIRFLLLFLLFESVHQHYISLSLNGLRKYLHVHVRHNGEFAIMLRVAIRVHHKIKIYWKALNYESLFQKILILYGVHVSLHVANRKLPINHIKERIASYEF